MGDLRPLIEKADNHMARLAMENLCASIDRGSKSPLSGRATVPELEAMVRNLYTEVDRIHRLRVRELDALARMAQERGAGIVYAADLTRAWVSDAVPPGRAFIYDPDLVGYKVMAKQYPVVKREGGWRGDERRSGGRRATDV